MKPQLALLLLLAACQTTKGDQPEPAFDPEACRDQFHGIPLEIGEKPAYPVAVNTYFRFYAIDFAEVLHYYGYVPSGTGKLMAHVYLPPGAHETVYLCHGFLVHSASYGSLIRTLLDAGYAVVAFDLPGHGFSTGPRASIASFSDYAGALGDIISYLEGKIPAPLGIIGLSTGSAVILEYLRTATSPFKHHILASPLVRSDKWGLSKTGTFLFGWFIKSVPTMNRDTTSDPETRRFMQQDPLKIRKVSLDWVRALYAWNATLETAGHLTRQPVTVIQGDRDVIVQWKYNLALLRQKIPLLTIHMIPGGKHELFLEAHTLRRQVFGIILAELSPEKSLLNNTSQ